MEKIDRKFMIAGVVAGAALAFSAPAVMAGFVGEGDSDNQTVSLSYDQYKALQASGTQLQILDLVENSSGELIVIVKGGKLQSTSDTPLIRHDASCW